MQWQACARRKGKLKNCVVEVNEWRDVVIRGEMIRFAAHKETPLLRNTLNVQAILIH